MGKIDREDVANAILGVRDAVLDLNDADFEEFMNGRVLGAKMFIPEWNFVGLIDESQDTQDKALTLRLRVE